MLNVDAAAEIAALTIGRKQAVGSRHSSSGSSRGRRKRRTNHGVPQALLPVT